MPAIWLIRQIMFQFTHPGRGATLLHQLLVLQWLTFQFTHPGRGATSSSNDFANVNLRFNSRTPGGVRLEPYELVIIMWWFQFTHPGRGAT